MELTDTACAILTPAEMRGLRKLAGMTLRDVATRAGISITQLSQYENATNGLRDDQVKTCEHVLVRAASERNALLDDALAPEKRRSAAENVAAAS